MTKKELLIERYKCIADYPENKFCKVGEILMGNDSNLCNYPHLFKKLEWWEERTPRDMPTYIKWGKLIYKNPSYNKTGFYVESIGWIYFSTTGEITPSTEEEFKNQK